MSRNNLKHFAQLNAMPHVLEFPENMAGKWHAHFQNTQKIVLELGCGRGEYTTALAQMHPHHNHIGTDVKGARIWHGAMLIAEKSLKNAAFLRTRIEQIQDYFGTDEIDEMWITFPDPQPREAKANKRLTSPRFLDMYEKFLKKGSKIHLKTDSQDLYEYTLQTWTAHPRLHIQQATNNLYAQPTTEIQNIKTTFERKWLKSGLDICYLQAELR
jgi:tRNA (guanine-N7-)-methyltransferase